MKNQKEHPTKYYSSRQESMIADYLGWKVVSGSGSRAFNPGDVIAENYLGECKTSEVESDRIIVIKSHLMKICDEAMSVHKIPVLFVDNGTQRSDSTFCVLRYKGPAIKAFTGVKRSVQRFSFILDDAEDFMRANRGMFYIKIWNAEFIVYTLEAFKEHIESIGW